MGGRIGQHLSYPISEWGSSINSNLRWDEGRPKFIIFNERVGGPQSVIYDGREDGPKIVLSNGRDLRNLWKKKGRTNKYVKWNRGWMRKNEPLFCVSNERVGGHLFSLKSIS